MYKIIFVLLIPFFMCSCAEMNYDTLTQYQKIDTNLKAMGVEVTVVNADLEGITDDIIDILHDNFSLDDTFTVAGNKTNKFYSILIPKMKQSGFKVLFETDSTRIDYLPLAYTFTVTNNHLIETPDVALLRVWVGDTFQVAKAFTWSLDGLQDKTSYSVIGGR